MTQLRSNLRHWLVCLGLTHLACTAILAQQTRVLLDDRKVLVTQVDLAPGESYSVPKSDSGAVWIALDPALLASKDDGPRGDRRIRTGDAAVVQTNEQAVFKAQATKQHLRLILVKPKGSHQELTVGAFLASGSLEDGSDRNDTLLIAISNCSIRDTRNTSDESEWVPGKPTIITMRAGAVRWIRPGIHHFKNLGSTAAKLVSIEW